MKDKFKDLLKEIKEVKYRTEKEWEIFLPYKTTGEQIQSIINICREHLLITWHIIHPEPNDKMPEPEIRMYWDVI